MQSRVAWANVQLRAPGDAQMPEENILSGLIGGEDGEEVAEGEAQVNALDAGAAALAAIATAGGPRLPPEAAEYYRRQTRLVTIQSEHLHEQRGLLLARLRVQLSQARLKRLIDRLKAGTQLFILLVATLIGLGFLVMVRDAFASRSVIVEPFEAPPALAARGLSGRVVAAGVLDELQKLRAATRTNAEKRSLSSAWNSDIKVEVPATGVSLGEIDRILRRRFGHDVMIDGDLVAAPDGALSLTVRGDGVLPRTFTGGADSLEALTAQAAEYIYGQSQPALYAEYLINAGRNADAIAFCRAAYNTTDVADRPYLLNSWADAIQESGGDLHEALALYRRAIALKPDYWLAQSSVVGLLVAMGDEEQAWRVGNAMTIQAGGRPGRAPEIDYQGWDWLTWNLQAWRSAILADAAKYGGVGSQQSDFQPNVADVEVRLHDETAALLHLSLAANDPSDVMAVAVEHFVRGRLAAERGDVAQAAAELEAFNAAYANPAVFTSYPGYNCWLAPAEEAAGRPAKADQVLATGGRFVNCYRFRGDILDGRGDWAGARKAYGEAVALAPDLPAAWYSWGLALARHGDLDGAADRLKAAALRGPHWADPRKALGDVYGRQGRWSEALGEYDQALRYAPAWPALRAARAEAARR